MDFVACSPLFAAVIAFSTGVIISGLFFAGVDAKPPEKVASSIASIQRWVGLLILASMVIYFIGSPLGVNLSVWAGTLCADFFLLWWSCSYVIKEGTDLKPIAWIMLLPGAVVLILYAITSQMLMVIPGFAGIMRDFTILLWVAAVGCLFSFIGIRWSKIRLNMISGWLFVVVGVIGYYITIRYMVELVVKPLIGG